MIDGKTSTAFSGIGLPPETKGESQDMKKKIITLNRLAYGSPQILVEKKMEQALDY